MSEETAVSEGVVATSWHSAPDIFVLGHKLLANMFNEPIQVEEKIDGSFIQFGKIHGEILIKSRSRDIYLNGPADMFIQAVEMIKRLAQLLHEGWTYRGEYLCKPKHNVITYDRTPRNWVILFDVLRGQEDYLTYEEKTAEAERLGLEVVPLIFRGNLRSISQFEEFLARNSILGAVPIEGVVFKNYGRTGHDKKVLMGKFVSKKFKEKHEKEWGPSHKTPGQGDILVNLAQTYTTRARWAKAVQHLREAGKLEDSPKDIGLLIREIQEDVVRECQDEMKDALWAWARKSVERSVIKGFPEWYKERLSKRGGPAFGDVETLQERIQGQLLEMAKDSMIDPLTGKVRTERIQEVLERGRPPGVREVFEPIASGSSVSVLMGAAKRIKDNYAVLGVDFGDPNGDSSVTRVVQDAIKDIAVNQNNVTCRCMEGCKGHCKGQSNG